MKCFTVVNLDVYDGIRIATGLAPAIEIGPDRTIPLSESLQAGVQEFVTAQAGQAPFNPLSPHVYLQNASLAVSRDGRMRMVPAVDAASAERALVAAEFDLSEVGMSRDYGMSRLGEMHSLKIQRSVTWVLFHNDADELRLEPVTRKHFSAVLAPGDSIKVCLEWFYRDPRGLMRRCEREARPVVCLRWDGKELNVYDLRLWSAPAFEVEQTF